MPVTNFPSGVSSFGAVLGNPNGIPFFGRTFFVDPRSTPNGGMGNDGFDGTSLEAPLRTLQHAIDKCKDWYGDRIVCRYGTQTITSSVLFNKKGITVEAAALGFNNYEIGERFSLDGPSLTTTPVALVSEPCIIRGLNFQGANATGPSLEFGPGSGFDGGNFCHLFRCRFDNWNHAQEAILSSYNDGIVFEECLFDGTINGVSGGANNFTSGIRIIQGHYCAVVRCLFRGCTYAITHGIANPIGAAHGNMMFLYEGNKVLSGKFLDAGNITNFPTQVGLIKDNYFGTATNATTYSDTVVNLHAIGMLFSGNHYAE